MCYPCSMCNRCGKVDNLHALEKICPICGNEWSDGGHLCAECGYVKPKEPALPGLKADRGKAEKA